MIRLKAMAMRTQGRKRSAGPTASGQSGGRSDGQREAGPWARRASGEIQWGCYN